MRYPIAATPCCRSNPKLRGARHERILGASRAGHRIDPDDGHLVRVVEYTVPDRDADGTGELIVLITTIGDRPTPTSWTAPTTPHAPHSMINVGYAALGLDRPSVDAEAPREPNDGHAAS